LIKTIDTTVCLTRRGFLDMVFLYSETEVVTELALNKCFVLFVFFRAARFNSVNHLTIFFPQNFGAESTKIYYIGLRGDFMQVYLRRF
jgi:PITH domain